MIFDFCKVIIDKHGPRLPGSAEEKAAQKDIAAIMENARNAMQENAKSAMKMFAGIA